MESDCSVLGIHILAFRSWFVSETLSSMDALTASSTPVSRLRFMNLFSVGIIALMYPTGPFWHCFMHPILSYRDLYPLKSVFLPLYQQSIVL